MSNQQPMTPEAVFKIAVWAVGDDTGVSSKFMAGVALKGAAHRIGFHFVEPSDAADLARCVRLVEAVPEVRNSFPVLAEMTHLWRVYVQHWDELEALFRSGNYQKTAQRMQELKALADSRKR